MKRRIQKKLEKQVNFLLEEGLITEAKLILNNLAFRSGVLYHYILLAELDLLEGKDKLYQKLIEKEPKDSFYLKQLGQLAFNYKDLVTSRKYLTKSVQQDPGDLDSLILLNLIDKMEQRETKFVTNRSKLLGLEVTYETQETLLDLFNHYLEDNDYKLAEEILKKLTKFSNSQIIHYLEGILLLEQGDIEHGKRELYRSAELIIASEDSLDLKVIGLEYIIQNAPDKKFADEMIDIASNLVLEEMNKKPMSNDLRQKFKRFAFDYGIDHKEKLKEYGKPIYPSSVKRLN
tara:strand:+ start:319 stop:1185 length:867 start_codon:yes stop_codon:yes gene_type:complete